MKRKLQIYLIILLFPVVTLAQPASADPPGDSPVPFGFTEVLLLAGAALGGKKLYNKKVDSF